MHIIAKYLYPNSLHVINIEISVAQHYYVLSMGALGKITAIRNFLLKSYVWDGVLNSTNSLFKINNSIVQEVQLLYLAIQTDMDQKHYDPPLKLIAQFQNTR